LVDFDLRATTAGRDVAFDLTTAGFMTLLFGEFDETKGELVPMSP